MKDKEDRADSLRPRSETGPVSVSLWECLMNDFLTREEMRELEAEIERLLHLREQARKLQPSNTLQESAAKKTVHILEARIKKLQEMLALNRRLRE